MQRQILYPRWYVRGESDAFLAVKLEFKPRHFSLPSVEVVNYSAFSHSGLVRPDGQITAGNLLEFTLVQFIFTLTLYEFIPET